MGAGVKGTAPPAASQPAFRGNAVYRVFWKWSKDFRRQASEDFLAEHGRPHPWTGEGRRYDEAMRDYRAKLVEPPQVHGSARWMSEGEARSFSDHNLSQFEKRDEKPNLLWLGRHVTEASEPIAEALSADEGHLITIAGTRAGKGACQIVPNLLSANLPMLVIDPKGENYGITAHVRQTMGPVFRFDPFRVTAAYDRVSPFARYNPLAFVADGSDAHRVAEMLVGDPPGDVTGNAMFFYTAGLSLLAALVLFASRSEVSTIGMIREIIGLPPEELSEALEVVAGDPDPAIRNPVNVYLSGSPELQGSIRAQVSNAVALWDNQAVAAATEACDFDLEDMKSRVMTVYVVLPLDRMNSHRSLLRMIVTQFYSAMIRDGMRARLPVIAMLDEFPALGKMEEIVRALGAIAGFNVRLWLFAQDIFRLRSLYREDANTILANCSTQCFFGISDGETARWLSEQLGNRTIALDAVSFSASMNAKPGGGNDWASGPMSNTAGMNRGIQLVGVPLMSPQEITEKLGVDTGLAVTRFSGLPAALTGLVRWFEDPELKDIGRNIRNVAPGTASPRRGRQRVKWGIHPVEDK